ncbi:hypothetical protein [Mesonia aquimarina]|uniref:hypothetical protein n=1 Tax=Mesonia aquimarina TaxID=1504967 RepID=UPI000EF57913|nr:hypothetical protein [Mesonia aquimarina]
MSNNYYIFLIIVLHVLSANAQQELYRNSFESTPLSVQQYTGNPTVHGNIISSKWTSLSGNTFSQENGNTGNALGLSHNGDMTYILTLTVAPGEEINLSAVNFWREKSKASMNWSLSVNQIEVAIGSTPHNGSIIGNTSFSTPINNLTGTVDIEITINGTGNGTFSLDDFVLYGTTTDPCPQLTFLQPNTVTCESSVTSLSAILLGAGGSAYPMMYQWKILSGGNYVALTNNATYTSVNSNTLLILNTPLSFDANQYTCEVTTADGCSYIMGPITLNVYPTPQPITIQFNN